MELNEVSRLNLCYEAMFPGLGRRNYILLLFVAGIMIYSNWILFINFRSYDYEVANILVMIVWLMRLIYCSMKDRYYSGQRVEEKRLFCMLLLPGLDEVLYGKIGKGVVAIVIFGLILFKSNFFFIGIYKILYIFIYKGYFKVKKLLLCYFVVFVFTSIINFPTYYYVISRVKENSGYPIINSGDIVLVDICKTPKIGDLITLRKNEEIDSGIGKRLIAKEGDLVKFTFNKIYVNDIEVKTFKPVEGGKSDMFLIPKNHYFVLGDNRNANYNSRYFGAIHKKYLKGLVVKVDKGTKKWNDSWKDLNKDFLEKYYQKISE